MRYIVTNIEWEDNDDLPTTMSVDVPDEIEDNYDKVEFISDEITNRTGFCHMGFGTTPEIEE